MRKIFLIISIIISSIFINIPKIEAVEEDKDKNLIYVVYDDSKSMYCDDNGSNPTNKWGQAKYAMTAFATMMDENDTMKIFSLKNGADSPVVELHEGISSNERKDKIISSLNNDYAGSTKFSVVSKVKNKLVADTTASNKWLIVITDGLYDDIKSNSKEDLEAAFSEIKEASKDNFKTVYLNIGENSISLDNDDNFYAYSALSSTTNSGDKSHSILTKLTEIENLIYHRQTFENLEPSEKISFTVDVPLKQITVFTQGANAEITNLTYKKTSKSKKKNYSYKSISEFEGPDGSGSLEQLKIEKANPGFDFLGASELRGVIATYKLKDGNYFEPGEYQLELANCESIEVYYELGISLELECEITDVDDKTTKVTDETLETLSTDKIKITSKVVHAKTGKKIDESLLKKYKITYNYKISNGYERQDLDWNQNENILEIANLKNGDLEIISEIASFGNVIKTKSVGILTYNQEELELTFGGIVEKIKEDKIEDNPLTLSVTKSNGEKLTEEEWNKLEVDIEKIDGLDIKQKKNDKQQTYTITLESTSSTPTGKINIKANAYLKDEETIYRGEKQYQIEIEELSCWDIILKYLPIIAALLLIIILFIIWYSKKARIPRTLKAQVTNISENSSNECVVKHIENNISLSKLATGTINIECDGYHFFDLQFEAKKIGREKVIYIKGIKETVNLDQFIIKKHEELKFNEDELNEFIITGATKIVFREKDTILDDAGNRYEITFFM